MTNPLFFRDVVALDKNDHRDLKLDAPEQPLGFARETYLIPAVIDEFDLAVGEIGIAFLPAQPHPTPVFVCGLQPDQNLMITAEGLWDAAYVPAYLRRYPFILGDAEDGQSFLCIDQAYEGVSTATGEALFAEDGSPAEPVERGLALAQSYKEAALRTDALGAALQEMGLLHSVTLTATLADGASSSVHGLMVVNEAALNELEAEQLKSLADQGMLRAIYSHLLSLSAISGLGARVGATKAAGPEDAAGADPVEPAVG